MRILPILLLTLPLAACQTGALDGDGPSLPPPNSRLVLKQELIIPPGTAHITLQGGRIVSGNEVRSYYPHCEFEVHKVLDVPQKVSPDEFTIRRAYQESRTVSSGGFRQVRGRTGMFRDGSSIMIYRTVFSLASSRQPDARWLVCAQWGDAALGRHLTLDEIRKALGEILTLSVPDGGKPA